MGDVFSETRLLERCGDRKVTGSHLDAASMLSVPGHGWAFGFHSARNPAFERVCASVGGNVQLQVRRFRHLLGQPLTLSAHFGARAAASVGRREA